MKNHFAIAPWEHPGAHFDPVPHAETRLEIGGKKRRFWLKMRDGVIFFRETNLVPLYAIPKRFDFEPDDEERLLANWKREVEAGNYGSFFISHRKWPGTAASANFCIILRSDGSGWIKEHFDSQWQEIEASLSLCHSVWTPKPTFSHLSEIICKKMGPEFLNRSVDETHFQTVPPTWSCGSEEAFRGVLKAALRLFTPPDYKYDPRWPWSCRSNSAFQSGSVTGPFGGMGTSERAFLQVWQLLKVHAAFVGGSWRRASAHPELQAQYKPKVWKSGLEKWGENWRGNWVGEPYHVQFDLPFQPATSQHEKLECAIMLRDFFRERTDEATLQKLLDSAISN